MEDRERCPRWLGEEYGWDFTDEIDWSLLRHNLRCMDDVIANPARFPNARRKELEEKANRLHAFIGSHAQHL